ncbi:MAG: hypothetical protein ABL921_19085 [Pirellula sp.]
MFPIRAAFFFYFILLSPAWAKDYLLTIAGGYAPQGNQASLEANVLFYQSLVLKTHSDSPEHKIYFADGFDTRNDLQIVAPRPAPKSAAYELLQSVFDLDRPRLEYRNHRVGGISGPISPTEIRDGFDVIKQNITDGDRLVIYVTSHGSEAKGKDKMDTTIACWGRKELSMKSFAGWLDELPESVSVVLVMAQCYCGGYVNTMFCEGNPELGLSKGNRVGFFAQRHDLPAAGCRPDIENDEEYSSFFWGACAGELRSGKEIETADFNRDGKVSFSEAHAFAVIASPTVDIPLKTSDEFLRRYSQINQFLTLPLGTDPDGRLPDQIDGLAYLAGSLAEIAASASPDHRRCVLGLAQQLELSTDSQLSVLFTMQKELDQEIRQARPPRGRGGLRGSRNSRRRDFRDELLAKWPELKNPADWKEIPWLHANACDTFLKEVRELSNYEPFQQSLVERTQSRERATTAELKQVRIRRLLYTIESIVLAKNLPKIASPEMKARYQSIRALEESSFK